MYIVIIFYVERRNRMEIIFTDEELALKKIIESEMNLDDVQKFAKNNEVIQLTCRVTDEVIANTVLNVLFKLSETDKNPIGLDLVSVATDANCITENTKKELVDLLDKCKAIITGDRTKELEELASAIEGFGSTFRGIPFPTQIPFESEDIPYTSESISVELDEGDDTNE